LQKEFAINRITNFFDDSSYDIFSDILERESMPGHRVRAEYLPQKLSHCQSSLF